jgi:L,D-peptidoglycan transpeptidase YkuD (ErfK/YbiS/YcfS/YnhG family)
VSRKNKHLHEVVIRHVANNGHKAMAQAGHLLLSCSIGPAGIRKMKREGDGTTPAGIWPARYVLYRSDRVRRPETGLPVQIISANDGWCDDPASGSYNRPVSLPSSYSHERLWREDHVYDVVLVIGHNDDPPVRGRGSAVFVHVRRPDCGPTHGCVAFEMNDLLYLLSLMDRSTRVVI